MLFNFFFSGHMFPLTFLPEPWLSLVKLLPLQYLAYFPAAVFLGKITGSELWIGLAVQAGWLVVLIVGCRAAMHAGFRRYSGYGG
jgi:ABC-2 type transport system permease protein